MQGIARKPGKTYSEQPTPIGSVVATHPLQFGARRFTISRAVSKGEKKGVMLQAMLQKISRCRRQTLARTWQHVIAREDLQRERSAGRPLVNWPRRWAERMRPMSDDRPPDAGKKAANKC